MLSISNTSFCIWEVLRVFQYREGRHPIFNHYITDQFFEHQKHPISLHAPIVHVKAVIKKVEPEVKVQGVSHYHLLIHRIEVLAIEGADRSIVSDEAFCAIRYGDDLGISEPIPGLQEGNPIELQGEYIDANHAYPSIGNPGDPVIHFTHHPIGYVIYAGKRYE
jgi:hypothetical protein